jgi:hypothetical protein
MCVGEVRVPHELTADIDAVAMAMVATVAVDSGIDTASVTETAFEETIGTKFTVEDITTVLRLTGEELLPVLHTAGRMDMIMAFISATQLFLAAVGTALCERM